MLCEISFLIMSPPTIPASKARAERPCSVWTQPQHPWVHFCHLLPMTTVRELLRNKIRQFLSDLSVLHLIWCFGDSTSHCWSSVFFLVWVVLFYEYIIQLYWITLLIMNICFMYRVFCFMYILWKELLYTSPYTSFCGHASSSLLHKYPEVERLAWEVFVCGIL